MRYIGNEKVGGSIHRGSNFTQFRVLWRSGLWIVETCSISVLEIIGLAYNSAVVALIYPAIIGGLVR